MTAEGPRKITIHKVPYNYWHSRSSCTCYSEPGEFMVPGKVADDAIATGYAIEGWASNSRTRTNKGGVKRKKATAPRKSVTARADAGADVESDAGMGRADVSAAHRAVTGQQPAPAAD